MFDVFVCSLVSAELFVAPCTTEMLANTVRHSLEVVQETVEVAEPIETSGALVVDAIVVSRFGFE